MLWILERWQSGEPDAADGRSLRQYEPPRKLSAAERSELLAVANSAEFVHLPPSQIVHRPADQQRYIVSESTLYRVLKAAKQLAHRRRERPLKACGKPRAVYMLRMRDSEIPMQVTHSVARSVNSRFQLEYRQL